MPPSWFEGIPVGDCTVNNLLVHITGNTTSSCTVFERQRKSVWLPSHVGTNTHIRRVSQPHTAREALSQLTNAYRSPAIRPFFLDLFIMFFP